MGFARGLRAESEQLKATDRVYADVDAPAALAWLQGAGARVLVHGHTHRPARHAHGRRVRWVLPDWEFDVAPPRGGYLQWDARGLRAVDLSPSQPSQP